MSQGFASLRCPPLGAAALGLLPVLLPRDDLEDLRARLRSPEVPVRRQAAEDLAGLDSPAAARLLLETVEDAAPKVRDEAVRSLGRLKNAEALGVLAREGPASDKAPVRLGAAEALGHAKSGFDRAPLLRLALEEKDPLVRVASIRAVGRIAIPSDFEAIRGIGGSDPEISAEALRAAAAIDPAKAIPLLEAALASGDERAPAALRLLGEADPGAGLAQAVKSLAAAAWRLRAQAMRTLERLRDARAVGPLIERLAVEKTPRLREDLARALRSLTGMKFRTDAREWERWWRENGAGFRVPPRPRDEPREGASGASFYGHPVGSNAVLFVIDLSGSMREPATEGGGAKKEACAAEFARTLRSLPPAARFNVLLVRQEIEPWSRKGLQPATPKNVEQASAFLLRAVPKGSGDFHRGLREALADPAADTAYFLSDGSPSAGAFVYRERLVEAIEALDRLRQIEVNTVLFGGAALDRRFMEELAKATGGELRAAK